MVSTFPTVVFYAVHLCAIAAGCCYGLSAVRFLRAMVASSSLEYNRAVRELYVATGLHCVFLIAHIQGLLSPTAYTSLPSAAFSMSVVGWLLAAGYLLLRNRLRLHGLGVFVSPIAMLFIFASAFWFHLEKTLLPLHNSPLLALHIVCSLIGHVSFVAAFVVSLALILQESLLKRKSFVLVIRAFPPLKVLDSLNTVLVSCGVFTMSLGVGIGIVYASLQGIPESLVAPRVVWSLISLLVYCALLIAIFFRGYRGRRAAWGSVLGYLVVVLSFASSRVLGAVFYVQ